MKNLKRSTCWMSFLVVLLCLQGCEAFSSESYLQLVQEKYPDAKEVKLAPGSSSSFLVNTGKEIRRVSVTGVHEVEITSDTVYMKLD